MPNMFSYAYVCNALNMPKYAIEKYAKICKNMQKEICKTMPKYAIKNMH